MRKASSGAPASAPIGITGRRDSSAYRLYLRLLGAGLVIAGCFVDAVIGWLLLNRANGWDLLLHPLAVGVWGWGLGVVSRSGRGHAASHVAHKPPVLITWLRQGWRQWPARDLVNGPVPPSVNGQLLVAILLSLCLFPGLGPLSGLGTFGMAYLARGKARHGVRLDQRDSSSRAREPQQPRHPPLLPRFEPADRLRWLDIQPLVDLLHDDDTELRRAAVASLSRQGTARSVYLVRGALVDPHLDVRSEATVALSRLDSQFSRRVRAAARLEADDPSAARRYAELCYGYAHSGVLDAVSARRYLLEALAALEPAVARGEPDDATAWMLLARLRREVGAAQEALQAVEEAMSRDASPAETYLLGMEIAFELGDWDLLRTLAHRGHIALTRRAVSDGEREPARGETRARDDRGDGATAAAALAWWAAVAPPSAGNAALALPEP